MVPLPPAPAPELVAAPPVPLVLVALPLVLTPLPLVLTPLPLVLAPLPLVLAPPPLVLVAVPLVLVPVPLVLVAVPLVLALEPVPDPELTVVFPPAPAPPEPDAPTPSLSPQAFKVRPTPRRTSALGASSETERFSCSMSQETIRSARALVLLSGAGSRVGLFRDLVRSTTPASATTMQDPSLLLLEILARRLPPAARSWQDRVEEITGVRRGEAPDRYLAETLAAFDTAAFLATFTAAPRVLGKAPLALDASEREMLVTAGVTWPIHGWRLDELGRAAMLAVASLRLPFKELERLLNACYQQGDSRERQALLRALPFMEGAERFVALAIDACRTNEQPLFEAIACENPYPAAHFPDLGFNQLVLKAMFMGIALDRIVGLERRKTSELARMARDFASERRAAGRSVPADIGLLYSEESDPPATKTPD